MWRSAREIAILPVGVRRLEVNDDEQSSSSPQHHIGEILSDVLLRVQGIGLVQLQSPGLGSPRSSETIGERKGT
jgi:hypothetical protein